MVFFSHTHTDINTHSFVPLFMLTARLTCWPRFPLKKDIPLSRRTEILMDAAPPPLCLKRWEALAQLGHGHDRGRSYSRAVMLHARDTFVWCCRSSGSLINFDLCYVYVSYVCPYLLPWPTSQAMFYYRRFSKRSILFLRTTKRPWGFLHSTCFLIEVLSERAFSGHTVYIHLYCPSADIIGCKVNTVFQMSPWKLSFHRLPRMKVNGQR